MSKKGLSQAEKRKRLCDIFYETRDFFQLKELEKIGPKQKGIVAQSVKEVLQSLVDDNLVTMEKIGTSNYYWSFPSTALQQRKRKIDDLTAERNQLCNKRAELETSLAKSAEGREACDGRECLLEDLSKAEALRQKLLAELDQFRECDPELLEKKENAAQVAKDAANRWTENIFVLQDYCYSKFNIERSAFAEQFGLPDDFDTIS